MSNDSSKRGPTPRPDEPVSQLSAALDSETIVQSKPWGPLSAVAIAVLLYLLSQLVGSIVISIYPYTQHWSQLHINTWINGAYIQFFYILLAEALTIAGLFWFMRRRKMTFKQLGWRSFRAVHILYALAGFGIYFVAYILLVAVASSAIPDLNVNQQQDIGFNQVTGAGQLIVTFVSLVILPPIVEETLFRGFLFTAFRKRMNLVAATLLVSLLFASPHLLEAQSGGLLWIAALDTLTLSVVLCVLREKTGSLWSGVLVHALKNGVAFLSLYILHVH